MGYPGPSWGQLGPILVPSWATLESSWGILGPSWAIMGHLGDILGLCWALLGDSWGHLGVILGHLRAILGPSWAILGPSWGHLGPFWGHLGPFQGYERRRVRNLCRNEPLRVSFGAQSGSILRPKASKNCALACARCNFWLFLSLAIFIVKKAEKSHTNCAGNGGMRSFRGGVLGGAQRLRRLCGVISHAVPQWGGGSLRAFRRANPVSLRVCALVRWCLGCLVFWPISRAKKPPESLQRGCSEVLLWS